MKHTSGLPAGSDARGQAGPPETLAELASLGAKLPLLFGPGNRLELQQCRV